MAFTWDAWTRHSPSSRLNCCRWAAMPPSYFQRRDNVTAFIPSHRKNRPAAPMTGTDFRHRKVIHVLTVGDDSQVGALLDRATHHGIRSDHVYGLREALVLSRTYRYHIILIVGIPNTQVASLCRCLYDAGAPCPILAITEDSSQAIRTALEGGADGVLIDPVDEAELIARLHAAIR